MCELNITASVDSEEEAKELLDRLATLKKLYNIHLTLVVSFGQQEEVSV